MHIGKRAIVIGAGIGGLSAARSLVGSFEEILVFEREVLTNVIAPRAGIPQGRHPHSLLPGGTQALSELFDNFPMKLRNAGAKVTDYAKRMRFEFPGQRALPEREVGIDIHICTRPLVESVVRRCVERYEDIVILDGRRVTELLSSADHLAVDGVRCETRNGTVETFAADLVVDASSRGELTLEFLKRSGRSQPRETTIGVDYNYATSIVEFPDGPPDELTILTFPNAPTSTRMGVLVKREDDRFFVTLCGRGVDSPPNEWEAFVEFASTLPTDSLYRALRQAKLHGKIVQFAFQESRRRHLDEVEKWPRGLIAVADAVCRFNPVHAQGMTVAAKEAVILNDLLAARWGCADPLAGLMEEWMFRINPLIDNVWGLAALPDLAFPDARGQRPPDLDEALEYQRQLIEAAVLDHGIHSLFLEVIGLITPADALRTPEVVDRVRRLTGKSGAPGKTAPNHLLI
ncbi:Putative epoxidase LasC [Paraburkholderia solisilvae]|uniref:Epoxidase LasC n=2 Tax=Paraburkholderia solisilvae TaxID=624376 RepID=A0A6J5E5M8_9BURK|nr:Putative epoxidase LasC [Paraburkholderia solisilvae]